MAEACIENNLVIAQLTIITVVFTGIRSLQETFTDSATERERH